MGTQLQNVDWVPSWFFGHSALAVQDRIVQRLFLITFKEMLLTGIMSFLKTSFMESNAINLNAVIFTAGQNQTHTHTQNI